MKSKFQKRKEALERNINYFLKHRPSASGSLQSINSTFKKLLPDLDFDEKWELSKKVEACYKVTR